MRAVLQYRSWDQDGNKVFQILAENKIEILKTTDDSTFPKVTIRIEDNKQLLSLVYDLNKACTREVKVLGIKSDETLMNRIKNWITKE